MNIKFKHTISIRNFLVVLYTCFCYETVEGAAKEEKRDEVAIVEDFTFTPRCKPILQTEFNRVARALYEDCIDRQSITGKNALELFKKTYTNLSGLESSISQYIENIHLVQAALYTFIECLNGMKVQSGIDRLLPAIATRESLVLAVAHCAFDYDNSDLATVPWLYQRASHWFKSSNLVSEVTINSKGVILKVKGTPILETTYEDHPRFGELCQKTVTFIEAFKKIAPVIERLKNTERLKIAKPAKE